MRKRWAKPYQGHGHPRQDSGDREPFPAAIGDRRPPRSRTRWVAPWRRAAGRSSQRNPLFDLLPFDSTVRPRPPSRRAGGQDRGAVPPFRPAGAGRDRRRSSAATPDHRRVVSFTAAACVPVHPFHVTHRPAAFRPRQLWVTLFGILSRPGSLGRGLGAPLSIELKPAEHHR
jgi:hypothetical protein